MGSMTKLDKDRGHLLRLANFLSTFWAKLLEGSPVQSVPLWLNQGSDPGHGLLSQLRMCSCIGDCSCLLSIFDLFVSC